MKRIPNFIYRWMKNKIVKEKKMTWIDLYKKACNETLAEEDLKSEIVNDKLRTKCNFGFHRISKRLGDQSFEGKVANQIYDTIVASEDWNEIMPIRIHIALQAIENGGRAVAIQRGCNPPDRFPSGHIAYIYPGPLGFSGHWEYTKVALVPKVANVGIKNGVMGANEAFHDEPRYFITAV